MTLSTSPIAAHRATRLTAAAGLLALLAGLGGCSTTNLSGIGGESTFKCKAPDGVQCQSVSGTYVNARAGNLPSQQSQGSSQGTGSPMSAVEASSRSALPSVQTMAAAAGLPSRASSESFAARSSVGAALGAIRSDPTVIRIWVAPWEDADGDLMDQTYVYLPIDTGRWLIEHNRQRIQREFAPVRAPTTALTPSRPTATREARDARDDDANAPDSAAALAAGIARVRTPERRDANAPGAAQ